MHVEVTLDGCAFRFATIGGDEDLRAAFDKPTDTADAVDARFRFRVPVKAGPHDGGRQLRRESRPRRYHAAAAVLAQFGGHARLDRAPARGPRHDHGAVQRTGPGDTPARRKISSCQPAGAASEAACAKQIIAALARRAYRQPVNDADLQPILDFYTPPAATARSSAASRARCSCILASPKFVFRVEQDPAECAARRHLPHQRRRAGVAALLLPVVQHPRRRTARGGKPGQVKRPAELDQQVRRMLADPKSSALVANFAGQWLQVRN